MDKNNLKRKNFNKTPTFSWGGTTPRWQKEAEEVKDYIEEKEEKKDDLNPEKHYYLRDQN